MSARKRVAVVGSGTSGMGALYALQHTQHELHLFEANERLGGHAHIVLVERDGLEVGCDFAFVGFNPVIYLLTGPSSEEYLNPTEPDAKLETIDEYLYRNCHSIRFRDDYLVPMTDLLWSTSPNKVRRDFPTNTLVWFLWNHHLLINVAKGYDWLSIQGGTAKYVDAIVRGLPTENVHIGTSVTCGTVLLELANGNVESFDHAVHGPQALKMISPQLTQQGIETLGAFKPHRKEVVLHADTDHMPKDRSMWSCWNYKAESDTEGFDKASVTAWLNLVMEIPEKRFGPILVTVDPQEPPREDLVYGSFDFDHP
ncbi:hypothetical protein OIDMADRAFT_35809 [Oidiodendron maius Zn]|uniref:Amine oxidase domain-containing protein n=1 Tax=Oidiodendron maius (strain Zn) TaxID=913774 RepID=A0A0C3C335_OIDMZ|nr:hypothetical protein OIDMADRAFT_35809 [Oidiodendron maius Zn]